MTPHAPIGSGKGQARRRAGALLEDAGAMGAVAIAVALNVALFSIFLGFGLPGANVREPDKAAMLPPLEVAPLDPSCDGDALLRAAAQAAMCLTPLADDVDACLDQTRARYESEVLFCHVDQMELLPEVAMVDLPEDRLATMIPIDAEPLLEPLTPEEMKQFEEKIQEQLPPPTPANQPPPPPPPPQTQVIETPKPENQETPDDARFVSEYDSKVEKQTANHENKYEEMVAKPKPAELTPKETPKEANDPDPAPDELDPGKDEKAPPTEGALSMRKAGAPERAEAEQAAKKAGAGDGKTGPEGDGAPRKGDGAVDQEKKDRTEIAEGDGGAGGGKKRAPNLKLDDDTAERIVGGGSVDHMEDVEEGDANAFNTKGWVHASFFNRMKRIVAQNWDPVSVWRREDPEGSHYGFKSRNTVLRVSLDAKGNVAKVIILKACGVDSLDDEAIRAMKASDPFPNPPQALLDKNGYIVFEFGFYFEINSKSTSWKVKRSI